MPCSLAQRSGRACPGAAGRVKQRARGGQQRALGAGDAGIDAGRRSMASAQLSRAGYSIRSAPEGRPTCVYDIAVARSVRCSRSQVLGDWRLKDPAGSWRVKASATRATATAAANAAVMPSRRSLPAAAPRPRRPRRCRSRCRARRPGSVTPRPVPPARAAPPATSSATAAHTRPHAQPRDGPGGEALGHRHGPREHQDHPGDAGQDDHQSDTHQTACFPGVTKPGLGPGASRPGQRGAGDGDAGTTGLRWRTAVTASVT